MLVRKAAVAQHPKPSRTPIAKPTASTSPAAQKSVSVPAQREWLQALNPLKSRFNRLRRSLPAAVIGMQAAAPQQAIPVAESIAAHLALPLYRIDLAAVVNRYLDETAQQLRGLLETADKASVVLLFDEADSLFGKRSDIQEAHDRYANLDRDAFLAWLRQVGAVIVLATPSAPPAQLVSRFDSQLALQTALAVPHLPTPSQELSMAQFSVNPARFDPYKNYKFRVKWDGRYVAGISRVSGLTRTTDVVAYRQGGDPNLSCVSPGLTRYEPLRLERGITHDKAFEEWANLVWRLNAPQGAEATLGRFRKDILIELLNEAGQVVIVYKVYRCWVSEYRALPELDANSNGVVVESITLQNEGWERDADVAEPVEPK